MKNVYVFIVLILVLGNGCKYFKKSSARTVDTLTADTISADEGIIDSAALYSGVNPDTDPLSATAATPSRQTYNTDGKYFMIVGCFTVSDNADKYAEKLNNLGYTAQIIPGRDNFRMVSVKSYASYRDGVADLDKFRTNVTPNAWVYRQK